MSTERCGINSKLKKHKTEKMRKRILVLGGTGMAGHVVYLYLKSLGKYEMFNTVFRKKLTEDSVVMNATDPVAIDRVISEISPDIVINCIGALIRESREHPDNAVLLNAWLPNYLQKVCGSHGAKLIHISTDCVFSGRKGHYTETDFRDADDVYGRSKALGEINNDRDLTIRTSIIGPELKENGEGLFHWFMTQKGPVYGFKTAIWGGVTTLELAKAIDYAIDNNTVGLVQLSNGEGISKYDLLCLFRDIWHRDIEIIPDDRNQTDKSIAKSTIFKYNVQSYKDMLSELSEWMKYKA